MRLFAFISRHEPTEAQRDLAMREAINLHWVGDRDAFSTSWEEFKRDGFEGVVVVHPWAALTAYRAGLAVGVFNNVNRAAVGEPPRFETTAFYVAYSNELEAYINERTSVTIQTISEESLSG